MKLTVKAKPKIVGGKVVLSKEEQMFAQFEKMKAKKAKKAKAKKAKEEK